MTVQLLLLPCRVRKGGGNMPRRVQKGREVWLGQVRLG